MLNYYKNKRKIIKSKIKSDDKNAARYNNNTLKASFKPE